MRAAVMRDWQLRVGLDGIPQAFRDLADPEEHAKIMVTP
jgi:hypothetical protein